MCWGGGLGGSWEGELFWFRSRLITGKDSVAFRGSLASDLSLGISRNERFVLFRWLISIHRCEFQRLLFLPLVLYQAKLSEGEKMHKAFLISTPYF